MESQAKTQGKIFSIESLPRCRPYFWEPIQARVQPKVVVEPDRVDVPAAVGQPHLAGVGVPGHGGVYAGGDGVGGHRLGKGF